MVTTESATELDFAVAAYREEGRWVVTPLTLEDPDLATLVEALRRHPGESGVIGLVAVADDFFLLVRVLGGRVRLLMSDRTAAAQWPLAHDVTEELGLAGPHDDEEAPAGDLSIVADLGLAAMDLEALCDDLDVYPDEALGEIADKLGFGRPFSEAVDSVTHG